MRSIKKIYFILIITVIAFLMVQCGENNNSSDEQLPESGNTENSGVSALKGDAVNGKILFDQTCSACHGMDAKGIPNLGKDLTTSDFVKSETDAELLEFIKKGRPVTDPLNTTGVAMPPSGGNPSLTEPQLKDITAYMKDINKK